MAAAAPRTPLARPRLDRRRAGVAAALIAVAALALAAAAGAHPLRGSTPFSIVLCNFSDRPTAAPDGTLIRNLLTEQGAGMDALADYWRAASYGNIDLAGSVVVGPYTMSIPFAQWASMGRGQMIQTCVDTARTAATGAYTIPGQHRTIAIVNDCRDSGAAGGRVLLDPCAMRNEWVAHETAHALGLGHSFSDDMSYQNASWSAPGEYDDPWDLMSGMNFFTRPTAFGQQGPGLNGPHLDRMGWLPRNRIFTFGADGRSSATVTLSGLTRPQGGHYLLARIPFDPSDLFRYYTVELRLREGVDRGIPAPIVLFHEWKNRTSFLLRTPRPPVQGLNANGVTVSVQAVDGAAGTATITITGQIAGRCLQGFVWREARPSDRVCVTSARRAAVAQENALAASRVLYAGGPCRPGYVRRQAFPGDNVCVTSSSRSLAQQENAAAPSRVNPARLVYGPNACKAGFVWREADATDYVCVPPATRAETATENQLAASRRAGSGAFGPDTCLFGFVWREAFPGDRVCVFGASRTRARTDNAQAASRVAQP